MRRTAQTSFSRHGHGRSASPRARRRPWLAALALAVTVTAPGLAEQPLDAKLQRLEGGKVRLSELRGQPVLLKLWATWCLPCREQARILHDLIPEIEKRDLTVLAVNEGEAPKVVAAFTAENPSDFPVVLDRAQVVAQRLAVGELPALALLDRNGAVLGVRVGLTRNTDLLDLLTSVDGGGPAPTAAAVNGD